MIFSFTLCLIFTMQKTAYSRINEIIAEASNSKLSEAFKNIMKKHKGKLNVSISLLNPSLRLLKRMKCHAMEGLTKPTKLSKPRKKAAYAMRHSAAAQKWNIMKSPRTVRCALASQLGLKNAQKLLSATLDEEKNHRWFAHPNSHIEH